ncbi:MAG TPA: cbb3-type cytochrome c oxidase N-terminal domain-containing protein [Dissulfurispiraceae bacterium]|nr:cbb3-type cytochrome c oxidase N-terminal domain-containing protein [Dissulfurispiraceae bacterium]
MAEDIDNLKEFQVEEEIDAARKIPRGWLILLWGLIIWGIYYVAAYSPSFTGWTQAKAYEESIKK